VPEGYKLWMEQWRGDLPAAKECRLASKDCISTFEALMGLWRECREFVKNCLVNRNSNGILHLRDFIHQLEPSPSPTASKTRRSLNDKIEREEQNASVTRKGRARSFLVLGGRDVGKKRRVNFIHWLAPPPPGIPHFHSIKFIAPSACPGWFRIKSASHLGFLGGTSKQPNDDSSSETMTVEINRCRCDDASV